MIDDDWLMIPQSRGEIQTPRAIRIYPLARNTIFVRYIKHTHAILQSTLIILVGLYLTPRGQASNLGPPGDLFSIFFTSRK